MRHILLVLFATASALTAQQDPRPGTVAYGFKVGSGWNDSGGNRNVFSSTIYQQSPWTGGPTVELRLPYRFSVEFDALYRTSRTTESLPFSYGNNVNPYLSTSSEKLKAWDLPLLLKYRFRLGPAHPFVSAGYQFTHESVDRRTFTVCQGATGSCQPADFPFSDSGFGQSNYSRFRGGPMAGAGLEFRTRLVTITPEVRVRRLINTYPHDISVTGLVGFTFGRGR